MYNRYVQGADGVFQRQRVNEPEPVVQTPCASPLVPVKPIKPPVCEASQPDNPLSKLGLSTDDLLVLAVLLLLLLEEEDDQLLIILAVLAFLML